MSKLETNTATTRDWLRATENIRVSAYDPVFGLPVLFEGSQEHPFTRADFEGALRKVSRPVQPLKSEKGKK
jgi:hypothetical protein